MEFRCPRKIAEAAPNSHTFSIHFNWLQIACQAPEGSLTGIYCQPMPSLSLGRLPIAGSWVRTLLIGSRKTPPVVGMPLGFIKVRHQQTQSRQYLNTPV